MKIIFVLGGPGVGKTSQCVRLVSKYPSTFKYASLGDVLRAEQVKADSMYAAILEKNLREGLTGNKEMVIELLQRALHDLNLDDDKVVLLDGFPRTLDRALLFESTTTKPICCIRFSASSQTLHHRLASRARGDDDERAVQERLRTWVVETQEVCGYYEGQGLLRDVSGGEEVEEVFGRFEGAVMGALGEEGEKVELEKDEGRYVPEIDWDDVGIIPLRRSHSQ